MRYLFVVVALLFSITSIAYAKSIDESPKKCGERGAMACSPKLKRLPCDNGLYLDLVYKRCKKPEDFDCGARYSSPCPATKRIPSCNPGLHENLALKKCMERADVGKELGCGKSGQRPCKLHERIPSCDYKLREHKGKCVK